MFSMKFIFSETSFNLKALHRNYSNYIDFGCQIKGDRAFVASITHISNVVHYLEMRVFSLKDPNLVRMILFKNLLVSSELHFGGMRC